MNPSTTAKSAACLAIALLTLACGAEPATAVPSSPQETPARILKGRAEHSPIPDTAAPGTRLADWPNEGSRWRLQLATGDLTFERSTVEFQDAPAALDTLRFGANWIVVRVGPVGEWYENKTLFLLLHAETHELHAAGSYLYSDMGGGGWDTIHGTLRVDPDRGPQAGRVRCSYSLASEGEQPGSAWNGSFEIDLRTNSESLKHELESFGVEFPTSE